MSGDLQRLPLDPQLPASMDPELRYALMDAFRRVHRQINQLSQTVARPTSAHVASEDLVLVDATGTATLVVSLLPAGRFSDTMIRVKKMSSTGVVMIVPQSGELIDDTATYTVSGQYTTVSVVSCGKAWHVV